MPKHKPSLSLKPGDIIHAKGEKIGTINGLNRGHSVVIEVVGSPEPTHASDEYDCVVAGRNETLHIDVFTDLFLLAEEISFER